MMKPFTLKAVRVLHLYSGAFLAPAILFFAITGGLQTFSLHETTRGSAYVPPAILVRLSQLHKKATLTLPVRKATPTPVAAPKASQPLSAVKVPDGPPPKSHLAMKVFFAVVAVGLVLSTLSGLVMAWKYARNKAIPAVVLLAGVALPLLLLLF